MPAPALALGLGGRLATAGRTFAPAVPDPLLPVRAVCTLRPRDRAQHAAEPGDRAEDQEHDEEPRRRAELAVEPAAEQRAEADRDPELEAGGARRQPLVHPPGPPRRGIQRGTV